MILLFMVLLVFALFGNILASFSKKTFLTKIFYVMLVLVMIIIAASQTFNNDYKAYEYYYNTAGIRDLIGVETGYVTINIFLRNVIMLNYEQFRLVYFTVMFSIVGIYLWRLSERPNLVLLFYFLLFFSVNITQIRTGMAEAFVIAAIFYFQKQSYIKYIILVLLGSSFHISALFFMIFILLKFEKIKSWLIEHKYVVVVVSILALIAFRLFANLIPSVVNIINGIGNDYRTSAQFSGYAGNHYLKYLPVPFFTIITFSLIDDKLKEEKTKLYEMMMFISLFLYPFFTINRQLSRISRTLVIISLVVLTEYLFIHFNKKIMYTLSFLLLLGFSFYALSAYTTCLQPLIDYSILSQIFND